MFKHLGRLSEDIIKRGGYKISALEIETAILEHPSVQEVVVVGIPDDQHGQEIGALVQFRERRDGLNEDQLLQAVKEHCRTVLSSYKAPRVWKVTKDIPKNAIGKVVKKDIIKVF